MKLFIAFLLLVLMMLQYRLWLGDGGVREIRHLQQALDAQHIQNDAMRARNEEMLAEVRDLKQGFDAIEERARSELGMIREGEVFYHTVEDDPPKW